MKKEDYYIDEQGYKRFTNSGKTIHRYIAKKNIWEKDRKKYPKEFHEYQVHHINKNKVDNRPENLELVPIREHELKHNIERHEYSMIQSYYVFAIWFLVWLFYLGWVSHYRLTNRDVIFFITTFIGFNIILYLVNKKKKGVRYV